MIHISSQNMRSSRDQIELSFFSKKCIEMMKSMDYAEALQNYNGQIREMDGYFVEFSLQPCNNNGNIFAIIINDCYVDMVYPCGRLKRLNYEDGQNIFVEDVPKKMPVEINALKYYEHKNINIIMSNNTISDVSLYLNSSNAHLINILSCSVTQYVGHYYKDYLLFDTTIKIYDQLSNEQPLYTSNNIIKLEI
jgi:hypothetical protein